MPSIHLYRAVVVGSLAVLPFGRFPNADALLGPEMKSTGEVMGVASDYPAAFGKAHLFQVIRYYWGTGKGDAVVYPRRNNA